MTKILVTGSAGLVGIQVVKDLVRENFDVYACYNETKIQFGVPTHLDLTKKDMIIDVFHTINPDLVIHLAAKTDVEKCELQKEETTLINTIATEILARESAKQNAFFIYVSTDYVFDGEEGLKKENDICDPKNFYGKSKLNGENTVKKFASQYLIIRTSTPFGIHSTKKSFPIWVKENLESGKEISVLTDQFTSPTFVPNFSKMLLEVIKKRITGTIHLAGATRISRYEFAKMIAKKLKLDTMLLKKSEIQEMGWNATRPKDSSLDVSKANKILDNKPLKIEISLELFLEQIKNSTKF
ncbi:SDR family oxidoreductase [Nitrosopumilus adriaticus]|uniref:dTDP-4-dehydrorhamnose reductase n=1 Tax=Nitrosopumilus adriaticus TaxID=1580092 RepID=A0A0D5C536_9ARCH|nr:SDR family oxidoreductase [Nitrosopumilus adriaticus]AJW71806.1 dTDP-4-dehydrorhamnose reductase [Nitrosopumilus adriaticus]